MQQGTARSLSERLAELAIDSQKRLVPPGPGILIKDRLEPLSAHGFPFSGVVTQPHDALSDPPLSCVPPPRLRPDVS